MTDVWSQAQAQSTTSAPQVDNGTSQVADAYVGEGSQLFSGPSLPPSLFNKNHLLGTERTGTITKAPYDVQSRDFATKVPKCWGSDKKPTPDAVNKGTGQPNRPVLDTVIELSTSYRFTDPEAAAVGREQGQADDGARAFYVSGQALKDLRKEINRLGVRSEQEM